MLKICTLVLALLAGTYSWSQDLPDLDAIPLDKKEDYNAHADSLALVASNHMLSLPLESRDPERKMSVRYLTRWMTGTPAYDFELGEPILKISKKETGLMIVYMATMTKYVLENKAGNPGPKDIKLNGIKLLLDYCKQPFSGVKIKGELKKAIEAYDKGELEKYIE